MVAGDPARRGVLPDHEAADGQPEPSERGARLGADVAGHRPLRVLPGAHEGALRLPEVGKPSNQNQYLEDTLYMALNTLI